MNMGDCGMGIIEPRMLGWLPHSQGVSVFRVADNKDVAYPVFDSDGYSILDRNSGILFSIWVGTSVEYAAIVHDPRVLYFVIAGEPE